MGPAELLYAQQWEELQCCITPDVHLPQAWLNLAPVQVDKPGTEPGFT